MKDSKKKIILKEIFNMSIYCLVLLFATFFIVEYVTQRTQVMGESMENTLHDGDHLMVDKITYRFADPERFDIIVFPYHEQQEILYIKRIIGLPNETVRIDEDGYIYINGEVLREAYGKEVIKDAGIASTEIVLGDDEYFVLGDNRNNSKDSRDASVGFITRDEIVGQAVVRIWPFDSIELLEH